MRSKERGEGGKQNCFIGVPAVRGEGHNSVLGGVEVCTWRDREGPASFKGPISFFPNELKEEKRAAR